MDTVARLNRLKFQKETTHELLHQVCPWTEQRLNLTCSQVLRESAAELTKILEGLLFSFPGSSTRSQACAYLPLFLEDMTFSQTAD